MAHPWITQGLHSMYRVWQVNYKAARIQLSSESGTLCCGECIWTIEAKTKLIRLESGCGCVLSVDLMTAGSDRLASSSFACCSPSGSIWSCKSRLNYASLSGKSPNHRTMGRIWACRPPASGVDVAWDQSAWNNGASDLLHTNNGFASNLHLYYSIFI